MVRYTGCDPKSEVRSERLGLIFGLEPVFCTISTQTYPEVPFGDPKLAVDSEFVAKNVRTTRDNEFRSQTGDLGLRAQLSIPGSSDQTDSIFELAIKF